MTILIKKGRNKVGLSPGSLVYIGEPKDATCRITLIDYDKNKFQERPLDHIETALTGKDPSTVTWINIDGIHDLEMMRKTGDYFGIHPLTLEDIVNTHQRTKLEEFTDYLFIVLKILAYNPENGNIYSEQLSIILGDHFLISLQEMPGDVFDPLRERIRKAKGRIRGMGTDYLAYSLMDAVVDNYFVVLETFGEQIEDMEDEIIRSPSDEIIQRLHDLKREMIHLRKQVWPLREVLSRLTKRETPLIDDQVTFFIRDLYDHTIQIIDTIESMRDVLAGLQDLYLSSLSNKMNEVMKMLTIISTIFIPLSFLAGVYGMNFKYFPELEFRYGYLIFWVVIIVLISVMVVFFRKKKWL